MWGGGGGRGGEGSGVGEGVGVYRASLTNQAAPCSVTFKCFLFCFSFFSFLFRF